MSLSKDCLVNLNTLQGHMDHMGKSLRKTLSLYQEASFSLETHILPSAHQLGTLPTQEDVELPANTTPYDEAAIPDIEAQSLSL